MARFGAHDRPVADRQGFDQRPLAIGNAVGQLKDGGGVHVGVFGKPAVAALPAHVLLDTVVVLPLAAVQAAAAVRGDFHHHAIAFLHVLHPFTHLDHHAAGLVAGGFAGRLGPLSIVGMQITAADAGDLGIDDHKARRGRDRIDLLHLDFPDAGVDSSFHGVGSLLNRRGCARGQSRPRELMAP